MVQLLARIDAQLEREEDPGRRASLTARKACYLARVGRFNEARSLIAALRDAFPMGRSPRASVWIMLAEGLTYTFESLSSEGLDRIARAEVLAGAMKDRELLSWASAWLAHWYFEGSNYGKMARALQTAFASAPIEEHEALARASMVLANAYSVAGEADAAQSWYMASRYHALEAGDQATVDALLYNRAAFGISWLRFQACFGPITVPQIDALRRELDSAHNYQALVGVAALTNLIWLWEARLRLLQGEFEKAIEGLETVRDQTPFARENFDQSIVDLEIAYCFAKLGRRQSALERFRVSATPGLVNLDVDERLYVAWLRSQLAHASPEFGDAEEADRILAEEQQAATEALDGLRSTLQPFAAQRPPRQAFIKTRRDLKVRRENI